MKYQDSHSQHFLQNPRLVSELIGHTNIRKNDTALDIGAGSGIISQALSRRCKKVITIEPESGAHKKLQANLAKYENIEIIQKDFLNFKLPAEDYKVLANIPFHLSSPIIKKLTGLEPFLINSGAKSIYLILQKQFARKLLADHNSFTSQIGAAISPFYSTRIRRPLKKTDYWPHPAVDTVLMEIKRREEPLISLKYKANFIDFISQCYLDPIFFRSLKTSHLRPSMLSAEEWVQLYKSNIKKG